MNFRIFEKYDCDRDGALNPQELINLFSTCPLMPWGQDIYNTVTTQPNTGWLGLPGFLGEKKNCGLNYNGQQKRFDLVSTLQLFAALWTLTTMLDTNKTLEYLAYLGYTFNNSHEDSQLSAINITR